MAKASGTCGVSHLQAIRGPKNSGGKKTIGECFFAFKFKVLWIIELNNLWSCLGFVPGHLLHRWG